MSVLRRRGTYRSEHRGREAGETAQVWAAIFLPPLRAGKPGPQPAVGSAHPAQPPAARKMLPASRLIHMAILTLWPGSGCAAPGTCLAASVRAGLAR